MDEIYFTIAGCNHYFGNELKIKGLGKCGYVANSPYTVKTIPSVSRRKNDFLRWYHIFREMENGSYER